MTLTSTPVADDYPTRTAHQVEMVHRRDPVVWGTAWGPIDPVNLASFESKGFTVVEGMLTPAEVQRYRAELARLAEDRTLRADERVITEKKSGDVRSIFDVHRISEAIAALATDPRILDRARQILGSEVYLHQTRVNYMPGFEGKGFYWHSDFETWHAEDGMPVPRAVSCSIALTSNRPFNGSLMLMPGSHRVFVPCAGETPDNHYKESLKEQRVGVPRTSDISRLSEEYGIEQFTGAAGSALWFDCNVIHGSGSNITPIPRSNIFLVFNSVSNALVEPYAGTLPRPNFIANRDPIPLR